MFWANKWMILFLEYCYETNLEAIEDNDYGQFVELD